MGCLAEAHTVLLAAIELYYDMDITFWLRQAEAALAQGKGRCWITCDDPSLRRQRVTRAYGRIWQNWVAGVCLVAVILLSGWYWHAAVILLSASAQESSPYAGMVEIPGGSFSMGRADGPVNKRPAHQVFLPTFYTDRNMVTVVEFTAFVQAKGPTGPHGEMYLDVQDPDNRIQQQGRRLDP
jgi:formylglycine-generating enzyme required for sulfatase activity